MWCLSNAGNFEYLYFYKIAKVFSHSSTLVEFQPLPPYNFLLRKNYEFLNLLFPSFVNEFFLLIDYLNFILLSVHSI